MKRIAAIYTGAALLAPLSALLKEELPEYKVINILDDALIGEVNAAGCITTDVRKRLLAYYQTVSNCGVDLILNTCSSIGEVVYEAQPFVDTPIVRIDDAMAQEAVSKYSHIGVIATLPSTLGPTMRLLERWSNATGRKVQIENGLAEGAFAALSNGNPLLHDQLILEKGKELAGCCDAIVLAQGSMARMEQQLADTLGIAVLSSPKRGIAMVRSMLEK